MTKEDRKVIRSTISLILLCGCVAVPNAQPAAANHLDWLTGCWQSDDESTREIWSVSDGGYLFGYSVVFEDDQAIFFEQMRIDLGETPIFNAYPRGIGPSAFPAIEITDQSVTFANGDHDYPQKIRYQRDDNRLNARISKIDDSDPVDFAFLSCEGE